MMRYPKATVCILNLVKRKELVIVIEPCFSSSKIMEAIHFSYLTVTMTLYRYMNYLFTTLTR